MSSVKTRVAIVGGKFLLTHPSSRITRLVVRLVVRRVRGKLLSATHAEAIPATRGSRLTTIVGIAVVAGGIVLLVRKAGTPEQETSVVTVPPPHAPFPPAATTPPETREAPPVTPTASPAAEAAAADVGTDDAALVMRVKAKLFGGIPPLGVTIESHSGVVTLRGRVADQEDEGRLVRSAEQVEGVKAVQSELQAAGTEPGSASS